MSDKMEERTRISAVRRVRAEQASRDAELARSEYDAQSAAVDERTARLRVQRLQREAATVKIEPKPRPAPKPGQRPKPRRVRPRG